MRSETSAGAIDLFLHRGLDATAGVKNTLTDCARLHSGVRVIDGRFTTMEQAMGTPKAQLAGGRYLMSFIEEMKACGFVAAALERSEQRDAAVAPAQMLT